MVIFRTFVRDKCSGETVRLAAGMSMVPAAAECRVSQQNDTGEGGGQSAQNSASLRLLKSLNHKSFPIFRQWQRN
jgi:hypothetical protein